MSHTIMIRLSDEQYAALEARARATGATIEDLVTGTIEPGRALEDPDAKRRRGLAALHRLAEIGARQPAMTSEEFQDLLAENRRELEERISGGGRD